MSALLQTALMEASDGANQPEIGNASPALCYEVRRQRRF